MSCNRTGSTAQVGLNVTLRTTVQACTGETELRHLSPGYRNQIIAILDAGDAWKELAAIIPNPDKNDKLLFSADDINVLDGYKLRPQGSPTNALFEHWSTFGRKRPTIRIFCDLLLKAKLHRAANIIAVEILKESPVENDCQTSSLYALNLLTETLALNAPVKEVSKDKVAEKCFQIAATNSGDTSGPLKHYSYAVLVTATQNFNDTPIRSGGCRLGEGAFGTVYRGFVENTAYVAIKKLKEKFNPQFITEMETLTAFKHPNLLPLLGYSIDGIFGCLVYEFMENGSLLDCLASKPNITKRIISWKTRISIATGTARGICHLHTCKKEPYIHRDIKSANILLDKHFVPKVGDFGLVRTGSSSLTSTQVVTDNVFGTSVYMAPEAFRGDVSVKTDSFSFGVVLLELLTGLAPHDQHREETDILSYLEENCEDIEEFLDKNAGNWSQRLAVDLYNIASKCIEGRKKNRPTMVEVLPTLEEILQKSGQLSVSLNESTSFNGITYV